MMSKLIRHVMMIWMLVLSAGFAADIYLINGVRIRGEVKEIQDDGLVLVVEGQEKTYKWVALSSATRYRYDTTFRMNYPAVLEGLPSAARTNAPDPEYEPPVEGE